METETQTQDQEEELLTDDINEDKDKEDQNLDQQDLLPLTLQPNPTLNYCYILYNDQNNSTYNGYTNNLQRRIRQHNGEIKGGAKYTTRRDVEWKYLAYITVDDSAFTQKRALSCEWHCKYPTGRRPREREFNSPEGRLRGLKLAKQNPKFSDLTFITYVCAKYAHLVEGCIMIP